MPSRSEEIRAMLKKGPLDESNPSLRVNPEPSSPLPTSRTAPAGSRINCPICDEDISARARKCRHCGETLDPALHQRDMMRQGAGVPYTRTKSKVAAGILAILLGVVGVHKYYLGRIGQGILYTLFFWTGIPTLLGIIEGIIYLTMDDERFWTKYG
ncbi:NINE protein [Erythrobacter alti]|uniref:NINE protein n=1 Tax=Erythrobacter alti TaxID=1896145 RepID=UPI0030F471D8